MKYLNHRNALSQWKTSYAVIIFVAVIFAGLIFSLLPETEAAIPQVRMMPESFSTLAETISPAVVNIRTVKTIQGGGRVFRHFKSPFENDDRMREFFEKFFGQNHERDFKQRSLGSGFIIDREGYIVTNNHVVEGADEIKVILSDKKEYDATVVGKDPNIDLALIKIKTDRDFPFVTFGDSDALKVGEWVMAIGSPFGLEHTVTAGIVSAKGRVIGSGPYDDFIQTDASINPGNSGGPLINMKAEVVGINTAIIASGQGIGFAIPIKLARGVIEQLQTKGEVTRGWLGVGIQDLSEEVAKYYEMKDAKGVMVMQVFPGDPADKAGIKPQDIILGVNGKTVDASRDLTRIVADIGVGEIAKVTVLRNGKEKAFQVKIAKREDKKIYSSLDRQRRQEDELGIRVQDLTPDIARRFNLPESGGIIVTAIKPDGKGAAAGVMAGDIIKEVNHEAVKVVDDYTDALAKVDAGKSVQLFIRRINVGFLVAKMTK